MQLSGSAFSGFVLKRTGRPLFNILLKAVIPAWTHHFHPVLQESRRQIKAMFIYRGKSHHIFYIVACFIKRDGINPDIGCQIILPRQSAIDTM